MNRKSDIAVTNGERDAMTSVIFSTEVFSEGNFFVGLCRELDVSSFGVSPDEAKASPQEAVETFLEGYELLGTLRDVLERSRFAMIDGSLRLSEHMVVRHLATEPCDRRGGAFGVTTPITGGSPI